MTTRRPDPADLGIHTRLKPLADALVDLTDAQLADIHAHAVARHGEHFPTGCRAYTDAAYRREFRLEPCWLCVQRLGEVKRARGRR